MIELPGIPNPAPIAPANRSIRRKVEHSKTRCPYCGYGMRSKTVVFRGHIAVHRVCAEKFDAEVEAENQRQQMDRVRSAGLALPGVDF